MNETPADAPGPTEPAEPTGRTGRTGRTEPAGPAEDAVSCGPAVLADHAPVAMPPRSQPFAHWWREGLRAGFGLRPRLAPPGPRPAQVLAALAILVLVELVLARLEVSGAAGFDLRAWLAPWWITGALCLLAWLLLPAAPPEIPAPSTPWPGRVGAWLILWLLAGLPVTVASLLVGIADARSWLPASPWPVFTAWAVAVVLWAWLALVVWRISSGLGMRRGAAGLMAAAALAAVTASSWIFPDRPWHPLADPDAAQRPSLALSQELFEAQQPLLQKAGEALLPQRPGVPDVYGLVFAPYAEEDVFLRESTLVAGVLAERFGAQGRVLHLVNHATTAETHPWATPLNLRRAIELLARRMDPAQDLLVVYLTSHGGANFRLAASHGALEVAPVSPGELREMLDAAGIRHRVIAISACYSGGWIGPLASDTSLVMTAADATHTSYGCGRLSELTFFGRAMFDEQLRRTRSFEQAFAAAVPVIRQREIDAGKPDGFSNPQISVGPAIRPLLAEIEKGLAP